MAGKKFDVADIQPYLVRYYDVLPRGDAWCDEILRIDEERAREIAPSIAISPIDYLHWNGGFDLFELQAANGKIQEALLLAAETRDVPAKVFAAVIKLWLGVDLLAEVSTWYNNVSFQSVSLVNFLEQQGISSFTYLYCQVFFTSHLRLLSGTSL